MKQNRFVLICIAAGLGWLALLGWLQRDRFLHGVNDFLQLYAGARLAGTPDLYKPEASLKIHGEVAGVHVSSVYYSRPPFYALLLKPLGMMPYPAAYWTFQAISLGCIGWFLWTFGRRTPELVVFAALFPPLIVVPLTGQDTGVVLALAACGVLLQERDKKFLAGLVWSLCAIKAHLFLLVPVVLLMRREWRTMAGGVAGGAALTGLSFLGGGAHWVREYLALLGNPELHPGFDHMPNWQAIRLALGIQEEKSLLMYLVLIGVPLVVGWIALRAPEWKFPLACAIAGGLLISYHAYLQDALLLLLFFALVLQTQRSKPLRAMAAIIVCPLPALLITAGSPWSAVLPLLIAAFLVVAARETATGKLLTAA